MGAGGDPVQALWAVALSFGIFDERCHRAFALPETRAHGRKTLLEVVHKAEEELFLLGTVSFILLVFGK